MGGSLEPGHTREKNTVHPCVLIFYGRLGGQKSTWDASRCVEEMGFQKLLFYKLIELLLAGI